LTTQVRGHALTVIGSDVVSIRHV